MTYQQTLDYLFSRLPMFQRIGNAAYKVEFETKHQLMEVLGHPEQRFKSIHVAGTNGKGSTSHMMAAVLQAAGYKTGLYTSPHLKDFRERIRINGVMISEHEVVQFVEQNRQNFDAIDLSFFEWSVGLAFTWFAEQEVDIAVIETGLGGRLDSTNVITPVVSVITNVGHDHQQFLGDTLAEIAGEKAGIIKQGVPVVIGEHHPETDPVFAAKAKAELASLVWAQQLPLPTYPTDLKGRYQEKNMRTALAGLAACGLPITEEAKEKGLAMVAASTGLRGRWQTYSTSPHTIVDVGHNAEGIAEVLLNLQETPHKRLFVVLGMVNDKDAGKLLKLWPTTAEYFFCAPSIPRAMPVERLFETATSMGLNGSAYPTVRAAYAAASNMATQPDDLIFVGGSTFVVADLL